jgi:Spy/CpxP family protein refolding chaperone
MIKWLCLAAGFPLLLIAQGGAQGGRALFPWWDNPLSQDLNLTDAQRNQIRALVKEYRDHLVDERAAVEKADGELEDVFSEDTVDQRRASEALDRLIAARSELTKSLAQMSLRMRTVLTVQQWQELQRRQGRGGPRPFGKNGRRGPPGSGQGSGPGSASGSPRGGGAPPLPPTAPPPPALK